MLYASSSTATVSDARRRGLAWAFQYALPETALSYRCRFADGISTTMDKGEFDRLTVVAGVDL
jgi:hypothetical protein